MIFTWLLLHQRPLKFEGEVMFNHSILMRHSLFAVALWLTFLSASALAQTTSFTYQGKLTNNTGTALSGQYDFQFKLFDTDGTGLPGTQQGTTQTATNLTVTAGLFTVQLDFGMCSTCFNGAARFLEIAVKPNGGGSFTTLVPRQPITSTPYAMMSKNPATAATADGLSVACVSCVTSSQIQSVSGSAVSGTIPVGSVPAGSASYIQNTTSPQATSNFNISGNGTLGGTLSANALTAAALNGPSNNLSIGSDTTNISIGGAGTSNVGISPRLTVTGIEGIYTNRINVTSGGLSLGFDASGISIGTGSATTSINIGNAN